jgi:surface antigen
MIAPIRSALVLIAIAGVVPIAGCDTMGPHEQQYTAVGGGLLGVLAGHGNGTAVALGAGSGLLAGCAAGNIIGRQLDDRDREVAEAATLAALNAPPAPHPVAHVWHSDHGTGNHGAVVVQSSTRTASGGECKEVNEVAYIQSKEVNQPVKYCRSGPDGDWKEA